MPLPLLAVQLLWLNLVTNGIQDVALAFEPGEGKELRQPPRRPQEPTWYRWISAGAQNLRAAQDCRKDRFSLDSASYSPNRHVRTSGSQERSGSTVFGVLCPPPTGGD